VGHAVAAADHCAATQSRSLQHFQHDYGLLQAKIAPKKHSLAAE
jgi:hypothetical protein